MEEARPALVSVPTPAGTTDPAELFETWRKIDALFEIWRAMHRRCENPKARDYKWYGARGIQVCDRWGNFQVFLADLVTEIGLRPPDLYPSGYPKYTLDRIDVNGNYEPGNIRWADGDTQARNRRPVRVVSVQPGDKLGRLTVVSEKVIEVPNKAKQRGVAKARVLVCNCECGTRGVEVLFGNVTRTRSCGCLRREITAETGRKNARVNAASHLRLCTQPGPHR